MSGQVTSMPAGEGPVVEREGAVGVVVCGAATRVGAVGREVGVLFAGI